MASVSLLHPRFHHGSACCVFRNGGLGSSSSSQLLGFHGGLRQITTLNIQGMRARQGKMTTCSATSAMVKKEPDHLLVLVHGILASPRDWTYVETELQKRLGDNFLIYASASNMFMKTFSGIDGAGRRLASEVLEVVKRTKSLKRISFLSHSLGGLFARYAISILYSARASARNRPSSNASTENPTSSSILGTVAGLEPINFVTLATPHLGVRGKNQLPLLLGFPILENLAPSLASVFAGRTGCQLFLTDGHSRLPPLLLRMSSDCEEGKFISALEAFKCRILYANVSNDYVVGWRTSSIRRKLELSEPSQRYLNGYKHVVEVENCPPVSSNNSGFSQGAVKAKMRAQTLPNAEKTPEYDDIIEEEMIQGLQRVGWKKVDVSFYSAFWPFFAHNHIHVKDEFWNNAGTGVVAHIADSIKHHESLFLHEVNL